MLPVRFHFVVTQERVKIPTLFRKKRERRMGYPRESIGDGYVLSQTATVIAVAAIAAVSARRIVEPSEAEAQPCSWN